MTSRFENITNFTDFFLQADAISGGYLAYSLVVTVFIVIFITTIGQGRSKALVYSSFVTAVILLILNMQGYVAYYLITFDLILFAFGIVGVMLSRRGDT